MKVAVTIAAVLLATASLGASLHEVDLAEDLLAEASSNFESSPLPAPPVKLDKNLRRALLKALVDLEAESAEQAERHKKQEDGVGNAGTSTARASTSQEEQEQEEEAKYDFLEISKQKSASFSFDGFPSEEDLPSEDKLQNSSFVESDKYAEHLGHGGAGGGGTSQRPPTADDSQDVQVSSLRR